MKFVIQRVKHASVDVDDKCVGKIDKGFLVLIGVNNTDTKEIADKMVKKLINMRIFEDEDGKMNRSVLDVGGEVLMVSQFTLYGDAAKGNRPSFSLAERPERANELYEYAVKALRGYGVTVKMGVFGEDMQISQHNDGPVTILLEKE